MKAYKLSIRDDDDAGCAIVFATNGREAKKQVHAYEYLSDALQGGWISLEVRRAAHYDGMEKLTKAQLALEQWHEGWRWFDMENPDPDEATDDEFLKWYKRNFEKEAA
jgi:hypothetical protein